MAYLIGASRIRLFVLTEENRGSLQVSSHSVEEGEEITDHVQPDSEEISISGELVGSGFKTIVARIKGWQNAGARVRYVGKTALRNCIITDFIPSFSKDIKNGCQFSMTLKRIRIASPAYIPSNTDTPTEERTTADAGVQSVSRSNSEGAYHVVKAKDTVYALVNGPYKQYGKTCADIMEANPSAFSRSGDFTSLIVGSRLNMG